MGRRLLLLVLAALLTGCPGGGGGGAGSNPAATPTQTTVSGSVQAPTGQIAFFKQRTWRDVAVSEAYAALTGLATVPDNTIVQLARLNANAATFTVLSTVTTSGGHYSFNLTALGLQPANDLIVRVAGSSGKEMRAFVSGTVADITPVSEAACQLIVQVLAGGPLTNLTMQEISDIHRAIELIAAVQDIGTATSVDQAVSLIKGAVAANAQVMGFIASTAAIGQTAQGVGDIGNFFPYTDGNLWEYTNTTSGTGQSTETFSNTLTITGTKFIGGISTQVFRETNPDNGGSVRSRIYASIPGNPGQIITIDPVTGTTGPSIDVGNEPNKLAISYDAQFLYVGLDGEAAIRRIDLASFTPNLLIALGTNPLVGCGPFIAGDIEVLPGFPNAVAVSKHHKNCTPPFAELAIYDDAVQRPNVVERINVTGSSVLDVESEFIEFSSSPTILYGFNGTLLQLATFPITSQGVSLPTLANIPGLIVRDVKFNGDRLYTDTGLVIDPVSGVVVGQFPGIPLGGNVVRPDATKNRTFFFPISAGCPAPIDLLAFDQTTLQPVGSVPIQGLSCPFSLTGMNRLIRWGANGLAGITNFEVVLLNTALIP